MALDFAGGGDRLVTVPRVFMKNRHRQHEVFRASTATEGEDSRPRAIQPHLGACPPAKAWGLARCQLCLFLLLVGQALSPLVGWAEDGFPPFMVEATITLKYFRPNPTNIALLTPEQPAQAEVTFYCSNGWWQRAFRRCGLRGIISGGTGFLRCGFDESPFRRQGRQGSADALRI